MFTPYGFVQFLLKNYNDNYHLIYNNTELGKFNMEETNQLLLNRYINTKWTDHLGNIYIADIRRYSMCNTEKTNYIFENGSVYYNDLPNIIIETKEQFYRPPDENNKNDLGGIGYQNSLKSFTNQI